MKKLLIGGAAVGAIYLLSKHSAAPSKKMKDEIWAAILLTNCDIDKELMAKILNGNDSKEISLMYKIVVQKISASTLPLPDVNLLQEMNTKYQMGLGNPMLIAAAVSKLLPMLLIGGIGLYAFNKISGATDGRWETKNYEKQNFVDEWGKKYNAIEVAQRLYNAMDGGGTYTDTLLLLAKEVRGSRWAIVANAYRKMYQEVLGESIQGELSASDMKSFNAIRDNVPTAETDNATHKQYEFGIGETVSIISSGTKLRYVQKSGSKLTDGIDWFQNWKIPLSIGKVTDRLQYKRPPTAYDLMMAENFPNTYKIDDQFSNYYKTESYPNYYITGAGLERTKSIF